VCIALGFHRFDYPKNNSVTPTPNIPAPKLSKLSALRSEQRHQSRYATLRWVVGVGDMSGRARANEKIVDLKMEM
jgi:hypothetical protein